MKIYRTEKESFSKQEILDNIKEYQEQTVPELNRLWRYYKVDNPPIMDRKKKDVNNPDNRTPSGYGRKLTTTFTGYAWRPRYTTYKAEGFDNYIKQLQETFDLTSEHIHTSKIGRNTAIFNVSKEILFIDGLKTGDTNLPTKATVKILTVDPRYMITYYDYSDEPKIKIAIKWDVINKNKHIVDVFYPDKIERYIKTRENEHVGDWELSEPESFVNFFGEVPAIDYYLDTDGEGLIKPIRRYIDDLDELTSGSIDEFMRFADSYLRIVGGSMDDPTRKKTGNTIMENLRKIRKTRVFNRLRDKEDITFLTKDIPSEYIRFISELIIDQIHVQSHVPDFAKFKDLSGVAVQRVMFDFENVCATAEANIDVGLIRRIELINRIYAILNKQVVEVSKVTIAHKRNAPLNIKEFAETAVQMKQAGFSRYLIADMMPDDIVPDTEEELARQDEDREAMFDDAYNEPPEEEPIDDEI